MKEGGAFAMIGGPNFLGDGGYAGTPIEEILPVRWVGKEDYRRDSSAESEAEPCGDGPSHHPPLSGRE